MAEINDHNNNKDENENDGENKVVIVQNLSKLSKCV